MTISEPAEHYPPVYLRWLAARMVGSLARQMSGVAVAWALYERTRSTVTLGLVGLVQIVPVVTLALPAGQLIDRYNRSALALGSYVATALSVALLLAASLGHAPVWVLFLALFAQGVATSVQAPAMSALVPALVPAALLERSNLVRATAFGLASVVGPSLGGLVLALRQRDSDVYGVALALLVGSVVLLTTLPPVFAQQQAGASAVPRRGGYLEGLRFVFRSRWLLPAITLDLFAVLFAGVTALLPVFARDVLAVGPSGLGWLRAAPALGALAMSLIASRLPPWKRPGVVLLAVVAGMGLATVLFAVSHSFALSLAALALAGGLDNVSVVIRMTLEQNVTPDELRGRVSAVQYVFVGLSNELGEFESGMAAALLGTVPSVVAGGVVTLVVVGVVAAVWPHFLQLKPLRELTPEVGG